MPLTEPQHRQPNNGFARFVRKGTSHYYKYRYFRRISTDSLTFVYAILGPAQYWCQVVNLDWLHFQNKVSCFYHKMNNLLYFWSLTPGLIWLQRKAGLGFNLDKCYKCSCCFRTDLKGKATFGKLHR